MRRDRDRPVIDRDKVYLKVHLDRGFDQPATGSSRAAKQVRTIESQEEPPDFTKGAIKCGRRLDLRAKRSIEDEDSAEIVVRMPFTQLQEYASSRFVCFGH